MLRPDEFELPADGEGISELYFHVIFWTRKLRPTVPIRLLADAKEQLDHQFYPLEGEVLAVGGTDNHMHILARLSPDLSPEKATAFLRESSAVWVAQANGAKGFFWNDNEVVLSLSPGDLSAAQAFIEGQQSHHEVVSFESELKIIFDEHGFEWDERALWD
jgi:REP element-mobilizing transposase RayT